MTQTKNVLITIGILAIMALLITTPLIFQTAIPDNYQPIQEDDGQTYSSVQELKDEYPEHSELIDELVEEGQIKVINGQLQSKTYEGTTS